jgi:hypothetical protein
MNVNPMCASGSIAVPVTTTGLVVPKKNPAMSTVMFFA